MILALDFGRNGASKFESIIIVQKGYNAREERR
jgi:hypothetical protein